MIRTSQALMFLAIATAASGVLIAQRAPTPPPAATPAGDWPTYNRDPGGTRFSPLDEITPANVSTLEVAWVYHMKPAPARRRRPRPRPRSRPGTRRRRRRRPRQGSQPPRRRRSSRDRRRPAPTRRAAAAASPRARARRWSSAASSTCRTPYARVVALDPASGKEKWAFQLPSGNPSTRGLEYWPGDATTPAQIVFGTSDAKLYSIDAATGTPNRAFGDAGVVNLDTPEILRGLPGRNGLTSPPIDLQAPRDHRRHDAGEPAARTGRRRARLGHAHGQAGVDVPIGAAAGRALQRDVGRRQRDATARASTCGASSPSTRRGASSTCRSGRRRSISTAAIAPATTCSGPAWSRPTPRPAPTCGTSSSRITTSGTPISPPRRCSST